MPTHYNRNDIEEGEKALVRQAQRGDRKAFVKLVDPYRERVYATAMRLLENSEDAADITQEAILRTFWKIQTFHGNAHFFTWLYRTALNLCYRKLSDTNAKIRSRSVYLNDVEEDPTGVSHEIPLSDGKHIPREEAEKAEEVQLVRRALASLDPSDFRILILREFEDLSYDKIAQTLAIPAGTVMSRLHRAREALAQKLRELGIT